MTLAINFNYLTRGTDSDKILHGKEFNIAKTSKYDGYQRGLASMVYKLQINLLPVVLLKMEICQTRN